MKSLLPCFFVFLLPWHAAAQTIAPQGSVPPQGSPGENVIPLYEGPVPNARPVVVKERSETSGGVTRISKITVPTLTVFRPASPNGQAVVICPGGGYAIEAVDKEGTKVAETFSRRGITAFVLKYRLPDDSLQPDKSMAPLQDVQQAIRRVRTLAATYQVDRNRIGIMGFSAGGHLAASAASHYGFRADPGNRDTVSARPDFSILIYPVISFDSVIAHRGSRDNHLGKNPPAEKLAFFSNEWQVNPQTPPAFLVHAGDDKAVPVENSIRYYQACIRYGVPAEMHLYARGGHGFGLYNPTTRDDWMERLFNWLAGLP